MLTKSPKNRKLFVRKKLKMECLSGFESEIFKDPGDQAIGPRDRVALIRFLIEHEFDRGALGRALQLAILEAGPANDDIELGIDLA